MTMTLEINPSTTDLILAEEPHLRRVARRLARCSADVDDLVQNTLLRAYAARDRFQAGTSIRAWTSTILRRVFLTRALCEKRRRMQLDVDADEPLDRVPCRATTTRDEPPKPEELAEELDDDLKQALDRLPEVYRRPFFLHVVQDMSCGEIAKKLQIPEGTVMSRIHRARGRLRLALTGRDVGGRPKAARRDGRVVARITRPEPRISAA
jgi:RNA polymerase sigma-70 factor (ECF subfamily)